MWYFVVCFVKSGHCMFAVAKEGWQATLVNHRSGRPPILATLYWPPYTGHHVLVTLYWASYNGQPSILVTLYWSPYTGHPILGTLYWSPYTGHPILVTQYWAPYTGHRILSNLYWSPYTDHPILSTLYWATTYTGTPLHCLSGLDTKPTDTQRSHIPHLLRVKTEQFLRVSLQSPPPPPPPPILTSSKLNTLLLNHIWPWKCNVLSDSRAQKSTMILHIWDKTAELQFSHAHCSKS